MSTPLLGRVQASNESWFRKVDGSGRFRAVIHPVNPTALPTSVFILPRIAIRVRLREPVASGELVRDRLQRIHLVGDHDLTLSGNDGVSRVHALFQMNQRVRWTRIVKRVNPVTKQEEAESEPEDLGFIWASIESYTHTNNDPGTRIQTDRLRSITAVPLQLGDILFGRTVRRTLRNLGVYVSEIE